MLQQRHTKVPATTTTSLLMADKDDAVSRRKSRRNRRKEKAKEFGKDNLSSPTAKNFFPEPEPSLEKTAEGLEGRFVDKQVTPEMKARMEQSRQAGNAGTGIQSIEETFGLGDDQLKELTETELPVPREDLSTGKQLAEDDVDENKVFNLPDLSSFLEDNSGKKREEKEKQQEIKDSQKIDRRNREEYDRVLQLNPFADGTCIYT